MPTAVLVKVGPEAGALVLGMLRPDPNGRFPRQKLSSQDVTGVWLVGLDDAGNTSLPVKLRDSEWVATPNPPAFGTNPHALATTPNASPVRAQEAAWGQLNKLDAGGTGGPGVLALSSIEWRDVSSGSAIPVSRRRHALAYDAARGRVVLFGGSIPSTRVGGSQEPQPDTWEWDGTRWAQLADTGPAARWDHAMAYDAPRQGGALRRLGVRPAARRRDLGVGRVDQDLATDDQRTGARYATRWRTTPAAAGSSSWRDAGTVALTDTWEWDGSTWSQRATAGPSFGTIAFDAARARTVLFDGASTWQWNGLAWSSAATPGPAVAPVRTTPLAASW